MAAVCALASRYIHVNGTVAAEVDWDIETATVVEENDEKSVGVMVVIFIAILCSVAEVGGNSVMRQKKFVEADLDHGGRPRVLRAQYGIPIKRTEK